MDDFRNRDCQRNERVWQLIMTVKEEGRKGIEDSQVIRSMANYRMLVVILRLSSGSLFSLIQTHFGINKILPILIF